MRSYPARDTSRYRAGAPRLDSLPRKAVGDGGHHLLGDRVSEKFPLVPRDEGGILELVRSRAEQPVPIDVGTEDDALRIAPARHEDAHVAVDRDIDLLEFATQHTKKRILGPHDGRLSDKSLQDLDKIGKIVGGTMGGSRGERGRS